MLMKRRTKPVGFTLIEMLVVIGVITLLMAALVPVISGMITTAREKATRATIKIVHEMLDSRMEAFDRAFETSGKNRFKSNINFYINSLSYSDSLAEIRVRKEKLREYFPQRFAESAELSTPSGHLPNTESAECLYYIIFKGKTFDAEPVDEERLKNAIKDTDNDGLMEFVDAWGKPLRFYRWPTRLIRPGEAGLPVEPFHPNPSSDPNVSNDPAPDTGIAKFMLPGISQDMLVQDSDDILNTLYNVVPWNGDETKFEYDGNPDSTLSFHTVSTFNRFLIVSSGSDVILGLYEPNDLANYGHLARPTEATMTASGGPLNSNLNDDITNRQRQGSN